MARDDALAEFLEDDKVLSIFKNELGTYTAMVTGSPPITSEDKTIDDFHPTDAIYALMRKMENNDG